MVIIKVNIVHKVQREVKHLQYSHVKYTLMISHTPTFDTKLSFSSHLRSHILNLQSWQYCLDTLQKGPKSKSQHCIKYQNNLLLREKVHWWKGQQGRISPMVNNLFILISFTQWPPFSLKQFPEMHRKSKKNIISTKLCSISISTHKIQKKIVFYWWQSSSIFSDTPNI